MPTKDEVLALTDEVGKLAQAVHDEREAKRSSNRRMTVAIVLVLVIAVRGQFVASKAQKAADKAQDAIELVIAQREESRKNTCESDNRVLEGLRLLASTSAQSSSTFAAQLIGNRPIEGALAERLKAFNTGVVEPFTKLADPDIGKFMPRDCSPTGLKEFYEGTKP